MEGGGVMVCKAELRAELERSLAAGAMTERFAVMAEEIVMGYFSQNSMRGYPASAKADFMSGFRLRLVKHWHKLDPLRNPFAAITQQGRWAGMDVTRKYEASKRLMERLRSEGRFHEALEETAV